MGNTKGILMSQYKIVKDKRLTGVYDVYKRFFFFWVYVGWFHSFREGDSLDELARAYIKQRKGHRFEA
jgi:hypothetical protein